MKENTVLDQRYEKPKLARDYLFKQIKTQKNKKLKYVVKSY